MPSLFRRRTTDLLDDAAPESSGAAAAQDPPAGEAAAGGDGGAAQARTVRGYTPSKRELGKLTPKRPSSHLRRPGGPPPRARKDLTKEERQQLREARRQRRREVSEGISRGDPQYLPARDQGPERALARDVVDSRRNVGTWFFGGALVILLASSTGLPMMVMVSNALFLALTTGLVIDSVLICRRLGRLVRERHPGSTHSRGALYFYAVMRSITFRRLRLPKPRVSRGDRI